MKPLYALLLLLLSSLSTKAQIKFVTEGGEGTQDGSSWANAWSAQVFADTIYSVPPGTQVWLAFGTYRPTKDTNGLVPTGQWFEIQERSTFKIQSGVKLFGGFAGYETSIDQRVDSLMLGSNGVNMTRLYGNDAQDNSRSNHVVSLQNVNDSTILDGLSFFSGDNIIYIESTGSQKSEPLIRNCYFNQALNCIEVDGKGSVLSRPIIMNSFFLNSYSQYGTAGINVKANSSVSVNNCVFTYCIGGVASCISFDASHGGSVNNCTFFYNIAIDPGYTNTAITSAAVTDSIYLNNSIFWNNYGSSSLITNTRLISGANYFSVKNCDFQAQDPTYSTAPAVKINCIDADPQFISNYYLAGEDNNWGTSDDGIALSASSPCRNGGLNSLIPSFITKDARRNPRVDFCVVDMGAYESKAPAGLIVLSESQSQSCVQYAVSGSGTVYSDASNCNTTAALLPSGSNPVTGIVKVCVTRDPDVNWVNNIPYVQRHYDIEPQQNPSGSTGRITLYFTQQDFDNYNMYTAGAFPSLPGWPGDVAGIANIKIEQDHGFSLTGVPGTYNGATVYIDPADSNIVWNTTSNVWEVSFNVNGFSGFFISTAITVIPVRLTGFTAKENNGTVQLHWQTATEFSNKYFDVQRSTDGRNFISIGKVTATGLAAGSHYDLTDIYPVAGINYYRLAMVDLDGSIKYSSIILVNLKKGSEMEVMLAPNPAGNYSTLNITGKFAGPVTAVAYDQQGKKVANLFTGQSSGNSLTITLDLTGFKKGIYIVEVKAGKATVKSKLIVQ